MPQILFMLYTTGAINQIYGMLALGVLVIVVWQWMRKGRAFINGLSSQAMLTMVAFCFLYFAIGEHTIPGFLYYFVCPLLAYATGWVTVESGKNRPEEIVKYSVYFMLVGYALHALLNYLSNIGHLRWQLTDFFTGEYAGATGSGCINTLVLSLSMYFIFLEKNKILKTAGIIASFISLMYALLLGTRAQFLILFVVSVLFLFFYLKETYGRTGVIRLAIVLIVFVGAYLFLYNRNIFGIRTYVDTSNLIERYQYGADLDRADNYRFSSILRGLSLMFEHPFGGLKSTKYYHNMWLDIGRVAGILPFLCMLVYTIVINVHLFRIVSSKEIEADFKYLLFCVYLGTQINFFFEPILEGLMGFFLVFTIINGMVEYYYHRVFLPLKHNP
ncbi:MAG: O-antigen ligase family protein [Oscillospiraceae bacterium]|nr:O-antigen ligase family protein [Oscillospiraceae bacterium]